MGYNYKMTQSAKPIIGNSITALLATTNSSVIDLNLGWRLKGFSARAGQLSSLLLTAIASIAALLILGYLAASIRPDSRIENNSEGTIRIYCAAGVAEPIQILAEAFNKQSQYEVLVSRVGGSGELAGQIKMESETDMLSSADLFITNDELLLKQPSMDGIYESQFELAFHKPVIAVAADSRLRLPGIRAMLAADGIKFGVASKRAAVGSIARLIAQQHEVLSELERDKTLDAENVMVLAQALVTGSLDAAVIWDTTVRQINAHSSAEVVKIAGLADPEDQTRSIVAVGIVGPASENSAGVAAFADFLTAPEFGQPVLESFGFSPVQRSKQFSR